MKKALTLIELIFTIVIIAFVFTVIPKIIYISNKTLAFSKKEDAIFNMMAKMMDVSVKEYDEKNTEYDDILLVNDPPKYVLDCNSSNGYRVGGFLGSRNCKNGVFETDVSSLGKDANEPPYDDVDDYNGLEEKTTVNGHTQYTIKISVGYNKEWTKNDYGTNYLSYKFSGSFENKKTNLKRIYMVVYDGNTSIASVSYYSANIGHIRINSVNW
jgi:Tfp pilus assembly protein PilE